MTIFVRHQSRGLPVAVALDGPGHRLLERIRAARAAKPEPARGRRRKVEPQQLELLG